MAKYYYEKYSINTTYGEGSWSSVNNWVAGAYLPGSTGNSYYASYEFSATSGYIGQQKLAKNTPPCFMVSGSRVTEILSSTFVDYGSTYHQSRYKDRVTLSQTKGSLIDIVMAENGTYPNNGISGGYWYVKGGLANTAPTISGFDSNLGDKNLGFVITYQVNDVDTLDSLFITEKLNGSIIKTINGAPRNQLLEIEISNETLFSLELNSENIIEIKVDDQQGGIAYRRYTFRRSNTVPIISGQDEDLGQKTEPFIIEFSASDNEGNAITVKTYLNNTLKDKYQIEDGVTNTFMITRDDWYKLFIGQHSIKIEATDEHGATAVRNYTFSRYDDKIQFTLKHPIETDIKASKILITPTWTIPTTKVTVEACNNAFDDIPTWENITTQVLIGRHFNFTNDIKTAEKWGIDVRFIIEKENGEECVIYGFGGAFE